MGTGLRGSWRQKWCELGKEYNTACWRWRGTIMGMAVLAHLETLKYRHVFHEGGQDGWMDFGGEPSGDD